MTALRRLMGAICLAIGAILAAWGAGLAYMVPR